MDRTKWQRSAVDRGIYFKLSSDGRLLGIIAIYVDDILASGTQECLREVFAYLKKELKIKLGDWLTQNKKLKFLGLTITNLGEEGFKIECKDYLEKILRAHQMEASRPVSTPSVTHKADRIQVKDVPDEQTSPDKESVGHLISRKVLPTKLEQTSPDKESVGHLISRKVSPTQLSVKESGRILGQAESPKANREVADEHPILDVDRHRQYRSIAGQLLWTCACRPDLQQAAKELSRVVSAPNDIDFDSAKRLLRYVKGTQELSLHIKYAREAEHSNQELLLGVFTDSDWAACSRTRRSTTGVMVFLGNTLLTSCSRTQPTVALSSAEAEYMALATGSIEARAIMNLCQELGFKVKGSLSQIDQKANYYDMFCDSTAAEGMVSQQKQLSGGRTKHIDIKHHFIREQSLRREVKVNRCSSEENTADLLTKPLDTATFERHRRAMGVL